MQIMIFSKTKIFICVICAFVIGYVTSCSVAVSNNLESRDTPEKGIEIASALSPDQTFKAIVWLPTLEGGLGATVSQPYQVWLEVVRKKRDGKTKSSLVFSADKSSPMHIRWISKSELEICYVEAQIFHFYNLFNDIVGLPSNDETNRITTKGEVVLRKVKRIDDC
jgi:hypothetical protein